MEQGISRREALVGLGMVGVGVASAGAAMEVPHRNDTTEVAGKVVLITGATSGIGRVCAERFAKAGAKIFFCGRREEKGREVAAGIMASGGEAEFVRCDVREEAQVKAFVDACVARHGKIDIAFNNAGIGQAPTTLVQTSTDSFRDQHATHVEGTFFCMKHEAAQMLKQPVGDGDARGVIINTGSIFGMRGFAQLHSYNSSKFALHGLTKCVAWELAPHKIRVLGVAPGAITPTDLGRWNPTPPTAEQLAGFVGPLHAMQRAGTPEEVAELVLFLASPRASFMTGDMVRVDGYFLQG